MQRLHSSRKGAKDEGLKILNHEEHKGWRMGFSICGNLRNLRTIVPCFPRRVSLEEAPWRGMKRRSNGDHLPCRVHSDSRLVRRWDHRHSLDSLLHESVPSSFPPKVHPQPEHRNSVLCPESAQTTSTKEALQLMARLSKT